MVFRVAHMPQPVAAVPRSGHGVRTRRSTRHSGDDHRDREQEGEAAAAAGERGAKQAASRSTSAPSASHADPGSDVESATEGEQVRDERRTSGLKVAVETLAGMCNSSANGLKLENLDDREPRSSQESAEGETLETGRPSGSTHPAQTSRRALQTLGTGRPSAQAVQASRRTARMAMVRSNWTGLLDNPRFIAVLVRVAAEKQVIPWAKSTNAVGYWLGAPVKTESFAGEAAKYNNTLLVRWRILREHATPALRQEFADYSVQENDTFPNATLLKEKCSVAMEQYANFFAAHIADPTNAEKRRRLQQHFLYSQCGPAAEFVARVILATDACRIGNATRQQTTAKVAVARTMLQNARVAPSYTLRAPTMQTTTSHSGTGMASFSKAGTTVPRAANGVSIRTRTRSGAQAGGQQGSDGIVRDSALGKRRRSTTRSRMVRSTRTKTSTVCVGQDDAHQQQQHNSTRTDNSNLSTSSTPAAPAAPTVSAASPAPTASPDSSTSATPCTSAASSTSTASIAHVAIPARAPWSTTVSRPRLLELLSVKQEQICVMYEFHGRLQQLAARYVDTLKGVVDDIHAQASLKAVRADSEDGSADAVPDDVDDHAVA